MSASTRRDVEILIHTAAPSRGQDDTRYRALARAYLDFEPAQRLEVFKTPTSSGVEDDDQAGSQLQEELILSTQERPASESYRPQGQDSHSTQYSTQYVVEEQPRTQDEADTVVGKEDRGLLQRRDMSRLIMDSPQLSFDSVLDNVDSPVFRGLEYTSMVVKSSDGCQPEDQPDSADSWRPPASEVADSQPEHNRRTALLSSPTRVLELYLRQFKNAKDPHPSKPRRSGRLTAKEAKRSTQERSRSTENVVPDSVLSSKRHHQEATSNCLTGTPALVTTGMAEPSPKPSKRARLDLNNSDSTPRPSSDNPPSSSVLSSTPPLLGSANITSYNLEIRPPPPPTSTVDLTPASLRTKSLQALAKTMGLGTHFQPSKQTRDLRPMERGYWLVHWQLWSPDLQKRSWSFLKYFIERGDAGWGVWCTRDDDFRMFRVYCWGDIVGHIYLLLHTASVSKIRGTGACWIDGQGDIVITMPSE